MDFMQYKTFIFDCDGVILDSNGVKTEAFRKVALQYGEEIATEFVSYHQANAGISRFAKVRYLHEIMLQQTDSEEAIHQDIKTFGELVAELLLEVDLTTGFSEFFATIPENTVKYVVSGGEQIEVTAALAAKGLAEKFDGIFGSPRPKNEILAELADSGKLLMPMVYFGDAKFDHEMALKFDSEFVFVSGYTDFHDWKNYFEHIDARVVSSFDELVATPQSPN